MQILHQHSLNNHLNMNQLVSVLSQIMDQLFISIVNNLVAIHLLLLYLLLALLEEFKNLSIFDMQVHQQFKLLYLILYLYYLIYTQNVLHLLEYLHYTINLRLIFSLVLVTLFKVYYLSKHQQPYHSRGQIFKDLRLVFIQL